MTIKKTMNLSEEDLLRIEQIIKNEEGRDTNEKRSG